MRRNRVSAPAIASERCGARFFWIYVVVGLAGTSGVADAKPDAPAEDTAELRKKPGDCQTLDDEFTGARLVMSAPVGGKCGDRCLGQGDDVMGPAAMMKRQTKQSRQIVFRVTLSAGSVPEARTGVVDTVRLIVDGKRYELRALTETLGADGTAETGALFFVGRRNVFVEVPRKLWKRLQKAKDVRLRLDPHAMVAEFGGGFRGLLDPPSCKELRR